MESLVMDGTQYILLSAVFLAAGVVALVLALVLALAQSSASELRLARTARHHAVRRRMR